jgi:hypothetical protein
MCCSLFKCACRARVSACEVARAMHVRCLLAFARTRTLTDAFRCPSALFSTGNPCLALPPSSTRLCSCTARRAERRCRSSLRRTASATSTVGTRTFSLCENRASTDLWKRDAHMSAVWISQAVCRVGLLRVRGRQLSELHSIRSPATQHMQTTEAGRGKTRTPFYGM